MLSEQAGNGCKALAVAVLVFALSACFFPADRLIQPELQFVVVDRNGLAVEGADVTLYVVEGGAKALERRETITTDAAGRAKFKRIIALRVNSIFVEPYAYYWPWCVEREGYSTVDFSGQRYAEVDTVKVELSPGERSVCSETRGLPDLRSDN